jgi:hypothetical protein
MSVIKKGASALGKLLVVLALAGTFIVGLVGVVYMSLQGEELKVPEIVGKDMVESEKQLASLGLRMKKRADRYSNEKPNTILEQLPKAGETVKTGQMILVVTSKTNPEGEEKPATIKKSADEEDDTEKIEELISDKPKKSTKTNTNTAVKKKSATTRDVLTDKSNSNSGSSDSGASNSNKSESNEKTNKSAPSAVDKPAAPSKPQPTPPKLETSRPATGGDVRPRKTPQP